MKKTIIVLFVVFFFVGFFIGHINETSFLPSFNTSYSIVFTPQSKINSFDGYTGEQLESILKGTKLEGLGFWFSYYAWQNNISSLYLVSHAIHESAWGTSYIARRKHNLFGFGAFDSSPYWSANYYPSYKDCIQQVSSFIAKNYLTEGGIWYEGETLAAINVHYASDKYWASKIANIMNMLYSKLSAPNKTEAIAENEYYQNFVHERSDYQTPEIFSKYVSKGQFIRDLYMILPVKHSYKSAGEWALNIGLVAQSPMWWRNKITRDEEIKIINKVWHYYYPYSATPAFMGGDFYEKYGKWYCQLIYKLRRSK